MAKKILTPASYDDNTIQSLPNQVKDQPEQLKTDFDYAAIETKKQFNNTLLPELQSETTNDAGANAIGAEGTFGTNNVGDELKAIKVVTDNIDSEAVKLTGDQTVDGIKTFNSSPVVPTPTTNFQASTKKYVDDAEADLQNQIITNDLDIADLQANKADTTYVDSENNAQDALISANASNIATNASDIATETTNRINGDASLQSQIDTIVTGDSNAMIGVYKAKDLVNTNNYTAIYAGLTLFDGLLILLEVANRNTGNVTFNLNAEGAKPVLYRLDNADYEIAASDFRGQILIKYDLAADAFLVANLETSVPTGDVEQSTAVDVIGGSTYQNSIVPSPMSKVVRPGLTVYNEVDNGVDYSNYSPASGFVFSSDGIDITGDGGFSLSSNATTRLKSSTEYTLIIQITGTINQYLNKIGFKGFLNSGVTYYPYYGNGIIYLVATTENNIVTDFGVVRNTPLGVGENANIKILAILEGDQTSLDVQGELDFGFNHVNGDMTTVSENLFDKNKLSGGEIAGNKYKYVDNATNFTYSDKFIENQQYTLTIKIDRNTGVTDLVDAVFRYTDGTISQLPLNPSEIGTMVSTPGKTIKEITGIFRASKDAYIDLETTKLQLGTTATPYTKQYSETSTVSKLKSVPSISDLDYPLDGKTIRNVAPIGQNYLHLDGTESWATAGGFPNQVNTIVFQFTTADGKANDGAKGIVSSLFTSQSPNYLFTNDEEGIGIDSNKKIYVRVLRSKLTTEDVPGWVTFLGSNNLYVNYQLETPVIEQGDSTQHYADKNGLMIIDSNIVSPVTYVGSQNLAQTADNLGRAITRLEDEVDRNYTEQSALISTNTADIATNISDIVAVNTRVTDSYEILTGVVIANTGWVSTTSYPPFNYYKDITVANALETDVVNVNFNFASLDIAINAGVGGATQASAGSVRILSQSVPTASMTADIEIHREV